MMSRNGLNTHVLGADGEHDVVVIVDVFTSRHTTS